MITKGIPLARPRNQYNIIIVSLIKPWVAKDVEENWNESAIPWYQYFLSTCAVSIM